MVVLLDTVGLPPNERSKAWTSAIVDATVPSSVTIDDDETFDGRFEWFKFGRVELLRTVVSGGQSLVRSARQAKLQTVPVISVALQEQGHAVQSQFGHELAVGGGLALTDLTSPYGYTFVGGGTGLAIQMSVEDLGLPMDVVRRATGQLGSSRLYELVKRHLVSISRSAEALTDDPGAAGLGAASTELVRALLASAADDRSARQVMAETIVIQIRTYIRQHLYEADLGAERIAAVHAISVRYLYRLFSNAGLSLEQWIISQRLSRACEELSSPASAARTVGTIARQCGFSDASHFSRRFRAAFAVSPSEWRRAVLAEIQPPVHIATSEQKDLSPWE